MKSYGRGELLVSLCYQPHASRLTAVVLKARNIPRMDMTGLAGKSILSLGYPRAAQSAITEVLIILFFFCFRSLCQDLLGTQWATRFQEEDSCQEAHTQSSF
jgi:hypothetical protein